MKGKVSLVRSKLAEQCVQTRDFSKTDPIKRLRTEIKQKILSSLEFRVQILKSVPCMMGLSWDICERIARSLREVSYSEGEVIVKEGNVGELFFIVAEGCVQVTRFEDTESIGEKHDVLGPGSYFGEAALLSGDHRNATVLAASPMVQCLQITKEEFDSIRTIAQELLDRHHNLVLRHVVEMTSIFQGLSDNELSSTVNAMTEVKFVEGTYIFRQETPGLSFFIILDGECDMTVTTQTSGYTNEDRIETIGPGNSFGQ